MPHRHLVSIFLSSFLHHYLHTIYSISMQPRAFEVKEILDRILSFANNATLLSCISVDKSWFQSSGKRVWRHLDSLRPLIELISPLEDKRTTTTAFKNEYFGKRGYVSWSSMVFCDPSSDSTQGRASSLCPRKQYSNNTGLPTHQHDPMESLQLIRSFREAPPYRGRKAWWIW